MASRASPAVQIWRRVKLRLATATDDTIQQQALWFYQGVSTILSTAYSAKKMNTMILQHS